MKRPRIVAAGAFVALAGLVAVSVPTDPPGLRHYTVQAGDTSWGAIVRRHCDGRTSAAAQTAFSVAATGLANGTVRVGQVIHVDPANCPAAPATTTSSTSTSTTSTTVAPTSTAPVVVLPSNPGAIGSINSGAVPGPGLGEAAARFDCEAAFYAANDPLVYPGQPGASHLHLFFGNTAVTANSTYESLLATGNGTCSGGRLNRSGYWMPAVFNGAGKIAVPDSLTVYYKANGNAATLASVQPLPPGLKMIAGYDMDLARSNPNVVQNTHMFWNCDGQTASAAQQTIPNCAAGKVLSVRLGFPACWDGVNLDSPNHRSHMAYRGWFNAQGAWDGTLCPPTHPVLIPEYSMLAMWTSDGNTAAWKLSSDTMPGMTHANGSTFHGDWIGAWDTAVSDAWLKSCLQQYRDCSAGQLGDGRQLSSPPQWPGPPYIDQP